VAPAVARPGAILTGRYTISGDTNMSAQVSGPQGVVRVLAQNLRVSAGERSLTWDGLDANGRPVGSGVYTLELRSLDPAGHSASGQATVTLDGTRPTIALNKPARRARGLVVRTRDAHTAVRQTTLQINGRTIMRRAGGGTITYRPRRGWKPSRYRVLVRATDVVGNVATRSRTFRIR
jgi:hypothetical protein